MKIDEHSAGLQVPRSGNIWKPADVGDFIYGDGGAIDAAAHELKTGEKVGGRNHVESLTQIRSALLNLISGRTMIREPGYPRKGPNVQYHQLDETDTQIANDIINNINRVIGTPNK